MGLLRVRGRQIAHRLSLSTDRSHARSQAGVFLRVNHQALRPSNLNNLLQVRNTPHVTLVEAER